MKLLLILLVLNALLPSRAERRKRKRKKERNRRIRQFVLSRLLGKPAKEEAPAEKKPKPSLFAKLRFVCRTAMFCVTSFALIRFAINAVAFGKEVQAFLDTRKQ